MKGKYLLCDTWNPAIRSSSHPETFYSILPNVSSIEQRNPLPCSIKCHAVDETHFYDNFRHRRCPDRRTFEPWNVLCTWKYGFHPRSRSQGNTAPCHNFVD